MKVYISVITETKNKLKGSKQLENYTYLQVHSTHDVTVDYIFLDLIDFPNAC